MKSFQCALQIRVTASAERRIQNLVERGFIVMQRRRQWNRVIIERGAFIKFAFGVDWEAPELYDVVLNMDKLSIDLAVNTVLSLARSDEIKACSVDALRSLEMMSLRSRAEAALMRLG